MLNLKQLKAEKPHPAQVVVELEKVEETLPDSAFKEPTPPPSALEAPQKPAPSESKRKKDDQPTEAEIQEQLEYLLFLGRHLDEPAGSIPNEEKYFRTTRALRNGELGDMKGLMREVPKEKLPEALKERAQAKAQAKSPAESQPKPDDGLPPGTIQGCAIKRPASNGRSDRDPARARNLVPRNNLSIASGAHSVG